MKKILIVTSSYQFVRSFLIPHIDYMVRSGWIVDVASDNDGTSLPYVNKQIDIPVKRTPFHPSNIVAIKRLSQHLEREDYDIINCHTPIGAMIARLASCKARRKGSKVIYMAHGFHFYEGAPIHNWLLYYTAEKWLARYTDAIITINEEDRRNASKLLTEISHQYYLHGVGYDVNHVGVSHKKRQNKLRAQYNLREDDFVCLYIARYTRDKNHKFLIKALTELQKHIPRCKFLLLGDGKEMVACRNLSCKLGLEKSVIFAGFHSKISDYLQIVQVGVSPSVSEGLGLGLVEEMCVGLPVLASRVRGHRDLIEDGKNGLLYTLDDTADFVSKLVYLYEHPEVRKSIGTTAQENISKYSAENIIPQMMDIFEDVLSS